MGADEPRSFSAIVEAKLAEFISYREVMERLTAYTSDDIAVVAIGLKQHGIYRASPAFLDGVEREVVRSSGYQSLETLIDATIRSGALPGAIPMWDETEATPDDDGWIRSELIAELRRQDLPCPDSLSSPHGSASAGTTSSSTNANPEWIQRHIYLKRIALWDAAKILARIAPSDSPPRDSDKDIEVNEWHYALEDAIEAGEISDPKWNEIRCEQMVLHADIRAWCRKHGHRWPIPDPNPQPATQADALAEIERLKVEVMALKTERDELAAEFGKVNASMPETASADSIGETARATLQKQIAALALLLSEKSNKYKKGSKPNANQIADSIDEILNDLNEPSRHGLSSANIRSQIASGLKLLLGE